MYPCVAAIVNTVAIYHFGSPVFVAIVIRERQRACYPSLLYVYDSLLTRIHPQQQSPLSSFLVYRHLNYLQVMNRKVLLYYKASLLVMNHVKASRHSGRVVKPLPIFSTT
jgi:hypothetical protein